MNEIALVADRDTATCFKLAGISNVFSVKGIKEAEEKMLGLLEKNSTKIILITERLLNKIRITERFTEQNAPLIIPIPDLNGPKQPKADFLNKLIYRKTGIEVKF
jgi:vacuolar-type H+-ATPase subunit F/Vma7